MMKSTDSTDDLAEQDWLFGLHGLLVDHFDDLTSFTRACIDTGRHMLSLSTGILSHIEGDDYEVVEVLSPIEALTPGDHFILADTYCNAVIQSGQPAAYHAVGEDAEMRNHPVYVGLRLESYIGVPVYVDEQVYGTLNFSDLRARPCPFGQREIRIVEAMAALLGRFIERERDTKKRLEREQMFEKSFRYAIVGKAIADTDARILDVNDALCRTFGYPREQMIGRTATDFTHPDDLHVTDTLYRELFAGERDHFSAEKRYISAQGDVIETEIGVVLLRDEIDTPRFILFQAIDVTDRNRSRTALEALNKQLAHQSRTDPLSGLANRRAFDETLKRKCAQARRNHKPLSLIMVDLDHFKRVNDEYGHPVGDEVLVQLAKLLQQGIREYDIAARFGGEEFAIVLPETAGIAARDLAERLRQTLHAETWPVPTVTASFGVAESAGDTCAPDALIQLADEALYRAKETGRNRVVLSGTAD